MINKNVDPHINSIKSKNKKTRFQEIDKLYYEFSIE